VGKVPAPPRDSHPILEEVVALVDRRLEANRKANSAATWKRI